MHCAYAVRMDDEEGLGWLAFLEFLESLFRQGFFAYQNLPTTSPPPRISNIKAVHYRYSG